MKKKRCILLPVILLMLCLMSATWVSAAETDLLQASSEKDANSRGWHTKANGKQYYIKKNGKRAVGWTKINGLFYYFNKNGILSPKTGWVKLNGKTYYIRSDRTRCEGGLFTINGKSYYFNKGGALVTNRHLAVIDKKYYNIDSKGVAVRVSDLEAKCEIETQKFIKKHTNDSMSAREKLRACFNYLLAYMHYRPQAPNWSEFRVNEWYYQKAINTFTSPTLNGNCYSFACCVASCAKQLGYKPTVVVITADHGFVIINGRYYDNMYGGLFDSSTPSHPGYEVYTKVEF